MDETRNFLSNINETHTIWHMALEPGGTKLQDIIVADICFLNFDLIAGLLSAGKVNAKPFDFEDGGFLLMYDGNLQRPYPGIIVWKYRIAGGESIITDMGMEDRWVVEPIWRHYLMPEGREKEKYIPPKEFIYMKRRDL